MATFPNLDAALFSKLTNDNGVKTIVTARVYSLFAPEGATMPYVIFYEADGKIPNTCPRDTGDVVYRVESRATSLAGGVALHGAIYTALHESSLTVSGWTNYALTCTREMRFPEDLSGVQYFRFVWDVRIRLSKD